MIFEYPRVTKMNEGILRDSHAVLLPAIAGLELEYEFGDFLANGGQAILLGESREEYVARRMLPARTARENSAIFTELVKALNQARGPVIVAVDQELGGIQRLSALVPPLPEAAAAAAMTDEEIEEACFTTAKAAKALGVTMFLAPILDVVVGGNPWLEGRTMAADPTQVARIGTAFVRGVQRAGVVAVAKHFPGYPLLSADPALTQVSLEVEEALVWEHGAAFKSVIEAGVRAVMTGPAPVAALDPLQGASTSPVVIGALRQKFGFGGLIVSDDLDAPATLLGRTLEETAIAALAAGADLLLVGNGPHIPALCRAIADAVLGGELPAARLAEAAARVRTMANS